MNISPNNLCAHKKTSNIAATRFLRVFSLTHRGILSLFECKVKKIIFKQQKNNI